MLLRHRYLIHGLGTTFELASKLKRADLDTVEKVQAASRETLEAAGLTLGELNDLQRALDHAATRRR